MERVVDGVSVRALHAVGYRVTCRCIPGTNRIRDYKATGPGRFSRIAASSVEAYRACVAHARAVALR